MNEIEHVLICHLNLFFSVKKTSTACTCPFAHCYIGLFSFFFPIFFFFNIKEVMKNNE